MAETEIGALEQVLRLCAGQAPQPWFPRVYVRQTGVSKEDISEVIEHLLLEGLLRRVPGDQKTGPGLVLTALGTEVLGDPEALERLRKGRTFAEGDRGGVVREALERDDTPYVSRILLALNVLVFVYGTYLAATAAKDGALQTYLTGWNSAGQPGIQQSFIVQEKNGGVTAESWLRGEWWRVLTCCFVHKGLLHLFMNMYMLWAAGGMLERMWGRTRFLLIYLIAGVVGSGVGVAHATTVLELTKVKPPVDLSVPLAGASTALCGILAAEAIWFWLNGRYLPRTLQDRWRNNLLIQTVMIVFISFFPEVSGWSHFGGAVGGALTALVLNYQRFGPNPWRWVALLTLVPISLLGYGEIQRMRMSQQRVPPKAIPLVGFLSDDSWKYVEQVDYEKRFKPEIRTKLTDGEQLVFREVVERLLEMDPGRREEQKKAEVAQAVAYLEQKRQEWSSFLDIVNRAGPYYQPAAIKLQNEDRDAITAHLKLFEMEENCLRAGKQWTPNEEAALREQRRLVKEGKGKEDTPKPPDADPGVKPPKGERAVFKETFLDKLIDNSNAMSNARSSVWDEVKYQVDKPVKDRRDKLVTAAREKGQAQRQKMSVLADKLEAAGPYKDEELETLRKVARDSQREGAKLLELADQCLRDGQPWKGNDQEDQEHKQRKKLVDGLREIGWIE